MSSPAFLVATPARAGRPTAQRVAALLEQALPRARRATRTWYDTFDWRLYRAGVVLEHESAGDAGHLALRPLRGGGTLAAASAAAPRFASALPAGGLRKRLLASAGARALLPAASATVESWTFEQRDREGRAVLRVAIEALRPAGTRRGMLHARLLPARGHEALAASAADLLAPLGFAPLADDPLDRVVAATGARAPLGYSARPLVEVAPGERVGVATARVLGACLGVVRANVEGARAGTDAEFLHDLRTALRRARSLLLNLRGVVPEPERGTLRREFAWASRVTGPARDIDVFGADLPGLFDELPAAAKAEAERLAQWLAARADVAGAGVRAELATPRWESFLATWAQLVADLESGRRGGRDALRPATLIVARSGTRLLDDLLRGAAQADTDTPLPALHELRKTAKKLRYLIEAFAGLLRPRLAARALATLKELQDRLGRTCDTQVQIALLRAWRTEIARQPGSTEWTREFARVLEEQLAARLARPHRRFLRHVRALSRKGSLRRLARALEAATAGA